MKFNKIKLRKMKKLFLLMVLLLSIIPVFSQSVKVNLIPVTTNSKSAL